MNITSRQDEIAALVRSRGFASVETLAEHFAVTPQTIRRDVNALCAQGLLRRRHGGAERMDPAVNRPYDARRATLPDAKRRIAAQVAALIPNHASVMLSIGTTPEAVAQALVDHDDLTVVTNNLNVAMALSANRSNRIHLPGGALRLPDRDLLGPEAEAMFRAFRADFGVYGVGGIEPDGALVDFDRAETLAREAIRESCRLSVLVADRSKFRRPAPAHLGRLEEADMIVLDGRPEGEFAELLAASGLDVRYPQEVAA